MLKYLLILIFSTCTTAALAQKNTYISEVDNSLTIKKVGILPPTDNVNGLYARYVDSKLGSLIKSSHRFDVVDVKDVDARLAWDDYLTQPETIKALGKKSGADALIIGRANKTLDGSDITLNLFLVSDGQLLAQETSSGDSKFDVPYIEKTVGDLYKKLVDKIPYKALVLSRQGNRVTMDLGAKDGLQAGTMVSVEQVLSVKRHPKFKFVLSSEKEIIGRIKIVKVDDTLSFGTVIQEKERGVVGVNSKITGLDFVSYAEDMPAAEGQDKLKDNVSFGKNPKEWLPSKQPSLGKLGLSLGLGTLRNNMTLQNAGSLEGSTSLYPQLDLTGEIWMTPKWFLGAKLRQGVLSVSNPQGGSPGTLSGTNSHYDLHGGYKFLLQDDFWGPTINLHSGFSKYSFFIDASTPLSFTSVSYAGLYIGLGGEIPVTSDRTIYVAVNLDRHLFPTLTETPSSSGAASDPSITAFSFAGKYKLSPQFWIVASVDFEFYSATFSGTGTRQDTGMNTSQSLTTFVGGIDYLF